MSVLRVYTKSKSEVILNDSHFVAKGGEGSVYIKSGTAYKITNIKPGRINELAVLNCGSIAAPIEAIFNNNGQCVGFTMNAIDSQYIWVQLFTSNFKNANSPDLADLSTQLINIGHSAHRGGAIIVDANEKNFIINNNDEVVAIDVNSWQTPNYPATAIMPSIADYRQSCFSEETDWYSLGVILFQAWSNVHPYRGRHSKYKQKGIDLIKARRNDLVSTFNSDVSTPNCFIHPENWPKGLREWFFQLFEKGKYPKPPNDIDGSLSIPLKKTVIGNKISASPYHYRPTAYDFSDSRIKYEYIVKDIGLINGGLYKLGKINNHIFPTLICKVSCTKVINDVFFQDLFGRFSVFIIDKLIYLNELDNEKILHAKQNNGVTGVVSSDGKEYHARFFDVNGRLLYQYTDLSYMEANFCWLDKEIGIFKHNDDLHIFSLNKSVKLLNCSIPDGAYLCSDKDNALFKLGDNFYKFSINK